MTHTISANDAALVLRAQSGDPEAYNQLFQRYHEKIKQTIYFYVGDQANANDLAQDVLLKIFRNLPQFKGECEYSTWMYRIIQNTIKNYFRATSLRVDSEALYAKEQELSLCSSPEYQLINVELCDLLETAVSQLSEELRLCYGLHIFEGESYEEIARKMHCPIGTVRSRIFRARRLVMGLVRLEH